MDIAIEETPKSVNQKRQGKRPQDSNWQRKSFKVQTLSSKRNKTSIVFIHNIQIPTTEVMPSESILKKLGFSVKQSPG